MRMPFERLVEEVNKIDDWNVTIGQLSERFGEPNERILDAIDASRMLRGERTYISPQD